MFGDVDDLEASITDVVDPPPLRKDLADVFGAESRRSGARILVAITQHEIGPARHECLAQAGDEAWACLGRKHMQETGIDDRVERSPQSPKVECIADNERCLDGALRRLESGLLNSQWGRVDTPGFVPALRQVEHVLAGAAADVQHRASDLASLFEPDKFCLRTANVPGRSASVGRVEARLVRVTVRIGHTARQRYTSA
jgi:hypothetical protein